MILADGAGKPVLLNSRAETIVGQADGLVVDANGLAASTPIATRELRDAIAAASRSPAMTQRLRLERPSRRAPLLLTVLPVWRLDIELPGVTGARVAITISEADAPPPINRVAFADTYRLTTRESEVAVLIGDGYDLEPSPPNSASAPRRCAITSRTCLRKPVCAARRRWWRCCAASPIRPIRAEPAAPYPARSWKKS